MDLEGIREDFPPLRPKGSGRLPVYFDNACAALRPVQVVEAISEYYIRHPSCHKRAVHAYGRLTDERYASAREAVRGFINAGEAAEVLFTRNTTEGINLVAACFPFREGDVVLSTDMEHNSNVLPWLSLAARRKIIHRTVPVAPDGGFDGERFRAEVRKGVRLVSVFANSHVTGISAPVEDIVKLSHENGAKVLVDAAQTPLHRDIDVRGSDVDFLALSFHKMLGPSGMGVLYGKREHLESFPQFLLGGETVEDVGERDFTASGIPHKFEAGLQDYAGAMGAEAAIRYLGRIDRAESAAHELSLNRMITEDILKAGRIRLLGPKDPAERGAVVNFSVEGLDSGELSILLDKTAGVMTRSGVHCCHSWYRKNGLVPSLRVSLAFYNTEAEVRTFLRTIRDIVEYY